MKNRIPVIVTDRLIFSLRQMKKTIIVLIPVTMGLAFFTACLRQSPYRQTLADAEQIMDERPDSAYALLQAIPVENLSKGEQAEWSLLFTQAMDKQYILHTSDSTIRAAADWFDKHGSAARRTKAGYYMGRVNQDLGNISLAQEYYLKALETGKTSGDIRLLALIRSNLGMLYTFQEVYEEALPQMDEAARLFGQSGDTVSRAYILRNMGRTYHVMDSIDLAISLYKQALEDVDSFGRPSVLTELGDVLIQNKSFSEAEQYLNEALQSVSPDDYLLVCLTLGRFFAETGRSDSARFYLQECMNSARMDTKAGAYYYLGKLALDENQWKESTQALWSFFSLQDSVMKQRDAESIRKIQSLFNFSRIEEERNRALQSKVNAQQASIILLLITVALSILSAVFFFLWKNHQKQKKAREALIKKYREESEKQLSYYKKTITQLTVELENQTGEKDKLLMDIQEQELQLEKLTIIIKDDELKKVKFRNTEIYINLQNKEKNKLTDEDQKALYMAIDGIWPDFRPSLLALSPKVKENEILMCCLMKADLKQVNVATYMNLSESAVSNKRGNLAKKLFGDKAVKSDLDVFILNKKVPVWV